MGWHRVVPHKKASFFRYQSAIILVICSHQWWRNDKEFADFINYPNPAKLFLQVRLYKIANKRLFKRKIAHFCKFLASFLHLRQLQRRRSRRPLGCCPKLILFCLYFQRTYSALISSHCTNNPMVVLSLITNNDLFALSVSQLFSLIDGKMIGNFSFRLMGSW